MATSSEITRDEQIDAAITAMRMERVDACDWATPAVREVLAEFASDLRQSIPLSDCFDRIRRAVQADHVAATPPAVLRVAS